MQQPNNSTSDAIGEALKHAPQVTATGLYLLGISLSDWVCIATLAWIAIQAVFFVKDRMAKRRGRK